MATANRLLLKTDLFSIHNQKIQVAYNMKLVSLNNQRQQMYTCMLAEAYLYGQTPFTSLPFTSKFITKLMLGKDVWL
jgi:hypothetical protein